MKSCSTWPGNGAAPLMQSRRGNCTAGGLSANARKNWGMAGKMVACRRTISWITFLGGWSDLMSTIDPPTYKGRTMQTHSMKL